MSMHDYWVFLTETRRTQAADFERAGVPECAAECEREAANYAAVAEAFSGCMSLEMPTSNELLHFLRGEYLPSRFEERNAHWPKGVPEGGTYSETIIRGYMDDLKNEGGAMIDRYSARSGVCVYFDRHLKRISMDGVPV